MAMLSSQRQAQTHHEGEEKEDLKNDQELQNQQDGDEDAAPATGSGHETANMDRNMLGKGEAEEMRGDVGKLSQAMSRISDDRQKQKGETLKREAELSKIKLKPEDVQLVMSEFALPKNKAERFLREANGDVAQTLRKLVAA